MGIRITCSNGHTLNVKTELAGRMGRCPKCNVRVPIPTLDEAELIPSKTFLSGSDSTDLSITSQNLVVPAIVEKATPKKDGNTELDENFRIMEQAYTDSSGPKKSANEEKPGSFLSDPSAVWYIQVPESSQQFGPTTGAVLQSWIQEKRIAPDMLVWKEGWSNWITAQEAFPELAQLFPSTFSALQTQDAPGKKVDVAFSPQLRQKIEKKKKINRNHLFFLILLGVIVLLGGVLVFLLRS